MFKKSSLEDFFHNSKTALTNARDRLMKGKNRVQTNLNEFHVPRFRALKF